MAANLEPIEGVETSALCAGIGLRGSRGRMEVCGKFGGGSLGKSSLCSLESACHGLLCILSAGMPASVCFVYGFQFWAVSCDIFGCLEIVSGFSFTAWPWTLNSLSFDFGNKQKYSMSLSR